MKFKLFLLVISFFNGLLMAQQDLTNNDPDPNAFAQIDVEPAPLNLDEIKKKIIYPEKANELNIQGKVIVRVLLNEKGLYQKHIVLKTPHELLTEEVVKHISELRCSPGYQGGKAVRCWVTIPFNFSLGSKENVEENTPRFQAAYRWETDWKVVETKVSKNSEIISFEIPNYNFKAVSACSFNKVQEDKDLQVKTLIAMGAKVIKNTEDNGQIFEMTKEKQRLLGKILCKDNYLCLLMISPVDKKSTKAVIQMLESKKVIINN